MIVTAQPFFNELDLLEIKFEELAGVVDLHVVVEAPITFTGLPKPLLFAENRARFARFPVKHVVAELPVDAPTPWEREAAQYRAVLAAVREIDPEIAIWCDADEVPRADVVDRFKFWAPSLVNTMTIDMAHMLFFFDRIDVTQRWSNAKIGRFDRFAAHQPWRGETHHQVIERAGWHFEYFGRREELHAKLGAVSHAPEEGCQSMRRLVALGERPGIERTLRFPFAGLPRAVVKDPLRWREHFLDFGAVPYTGLV